MLLSSRQITIPELNELINTTLHFLGFLLTSIIDYLIILKIPLQYISKQQAFHNIILVLPVHYHASGMAQKLEQTYLNQWSHKMSKIPQLHCLVAKLLFKHEGCILKIYNKLLKDACKASYRYKVQSIQHHNLERRMNLIP